MRVLESVRKALMVMNVLIRRRVEMTETDAVIRSMMIKIWT